MSTQQNPQVESQKAGGGREANGRFAKGNMGGPGNPFARQSAQLRQAMLDNVSKEEIARIIKSMVVLAFAGNVQAAKLVFHYVIGKPTEAFNPDRMDQEEFDLYKEGDGNCAQAMRMMQEPDTRLPVSALRAMRWVNHDKGKDAILNGLRKQDKDQGIVREPSSPLYVPPEAEETPIGNGDNGRVAGSEHGGEGPESGQIPSTCGSSGLHFAGPSHPCSDPATHPTQEPLGNGDNGGVAPIGNGSNGRGPELFVRYGPKMSRRALRKARKAAKLAAMMPSKNGKH